MLNANLIASYASSASESATAYGYVLISKTSESGVTTQHTFKNQLSNFARAQAAYMWVGPTAANYIVPTVPSSIQIGTGAPVAPLTNVDPTDTALWAPMGGTGTKVLDFSTVWLNYTSQYSVTYNVGEAVGAWTEAGLFDALGNMFAHVQLIGFSKLSGDTVTVQWNVLHIGN